MRQINWVFREPALVGRTLSSHIAWRASGLAYVSAVIATHGSLVVPADYINRCRQQMRQIEPWIIGPSCRVLEFGSGIGGNLIALASKIGEGFGVDINPGYVRIARNLARAQDVANLAFACYDGNEIPLGTGHYDCVFSVGVFERLPREQVLRYVSDLGKGLSPNGRMCLYFLTERARQSLLTRRLGPERYTYWDIEDLSNRLEQTEFAIESTEPWEGLDRVERPAGALPPADLIVMRKQPSTTRSTES